MTGRECDRGVWQQKRTDTRAMRISAPLFPLKPTSSAVATDNFRREGRLGLLGVASWLARDWRLPSVPLDWGRELATPSPTSASSPSPSSWSLPLVEPPPKNVMVLPKDRVLRCPEERGTEGSAGHSRANGETTVSPRPRL